MDEFCFLTSISCTQNYLGQSGFKYVICMMGLVRSVDALVNLLADVLLKEPCCINNFSQSTQSDFGPGNRSKPPPKTSLLDGVLKEVERRKKLRQHSKLKSQEVNKGQAAQQVRTVGALSLVMSRHARTLTDKEVMSLMGTAPLLYIYIIT